MSDVVTWRWFRHPQCSGRKVTASSHCLDGWDSHKRSPRCVESEDYFEDGDCEYKNMASVKKKANSQSKDHAATVCFVNKGSNLK